MIHKIKLAILSLFGLLILSAGNAQPVFYSLSLQNLYHSLPEACVINHTITRDTVVLCYDIVQGDVVPLVFCFDENAVLEHIGFRFLASDSTFTRNNVIVRFIERELLTLLTTDNIEQTLVSYKENGMSVLLNDSQINQSVLQNKQSFIRLLKNINDIEINYDGKKYAVLLSLENEQKLSFNFSTDSELQTGMDKKERDMQLAFQLKNHKIKGNITVSSDHNSLKLPCGSIYVVKGGFFMVPQINGDVFYTKIDNAYRLIFDSLWLAETFANTLVAPANRSYTINITHRMYGNRVEKYTVGSQDFDDYFREEYCRYFGIETLGREKLTGTLILHNRNAGCIHLFFVQVKKEDLLNDGTMEMTLYSNIPQHNLKPLFGK